MRREVTPVLPHRDVTVTTDDGVRLQGIVVPAALPAPLLPGERPVTFVLAHGFTNSTARAPFRRLAGYLRRFGEVRGLDFRGHGRSGGASGAGGDPELLDVDAAVRAARRDGATTVVTLGLSMGGGAVLRQAAAGAHRPDAVVGVSAVSRWFVRDTPPMRRVHWLLETTAGRRLGSRVMRVRLAPPWPTNPPSPVELVSGIAPTPLLLVHGDRDAYFPVEHFRSLARAAGPGAAVWVVPGMGHAENGMTGPLAERIGRWARETVGRDRQCEHDPVTPADAHRTVR